jgi:hypothetical protein
MLSVTKIRNLMLAEPLPVRDLSHLSAASGLVRIGNLLYVVADDEHHLGIFDLHDTAPGKAPRILPGDLPERQAERKAHKPDLESLVLLPPFDGFANGALLAVGSGSTPHRDRGVLMGLGADGMPGNQRLIIDFSVLFSMLRAQFSQLNIEGAVVRGTRLVFLQRGNNADPVNACIDIDLSYLWQMLRNAGSDDPLGEMGIQRFTLGTVGSVPLCFTDAAALPNGDLLFSAVAEDTGDSYHDGICVGSAIGILKKDGVLHSVIPLDRPYKIEGMDACVEGDVVHLLLVTDPDDASQASSLLKAELHGYPFQ